MLRTLKTSRARCAPLLPAPLPILAAYLTFMVAGMGGGVAQSAGPARMIELLPPAPDQRYAACQVTIEAQPDLALQRALDWEVEGGGALARECAAAALAALDRLDEAARRYTSLADEMATVDAPYASGLRQEAARLWLVAEAPERALRALNDAIDLTPGDATVHVQRSRVLERLDRPWEALDDLWSADQLDPGRIDILVRRARLYRDVGMPELAIIDLNRAIGREGRDVELLWERAMSHLALDDAESAIADLEAIVQSTPDGHWTDTANRALTRLTGGD